MGAAAQGAGVQPGHTRLSREPKWPMITRKGAASSGLNSILPRQCCDLEAGWVGAQGRSPCLLRATGTMGAIAACLILFSCPNMCFVQGPHAQHGHFPFPPNSCSSHRNSRNRSAADYPKHPSSNTPARWQHKPEAPSLRSLQTGLAARRHQQLDRCRNQGPLRWYSSLTARRCWWC